MQRTARGPLLPRSWRRTPGPLRSPLPLRPTGGRTLSANGKNGRKNGRSRAGKPTAEWKAAWLEAFAEHLTVTAACEAAEVGRSSVYQARKADPEFAASWDEVEAKITDTLEREAYRRATEGVEQPVFHQGRQVGTVLKFSDRMLEMLLRARKPEKYRDRISIEDEREAAARRELEAATDAELDSKLTGVPDNVIPLRRTG